MIPDWMIHDNYETMTEIMTGAVLNPSGGKIVLPYGRERIAFLLDPGDAMHGSREYQWVWGK